MKNTDLKLFDFCTVRLSDDEKSLVILDQTLLPNEMRYLTLQDEESIWDSIYKLRVRGAPAIGVAAAYGLYVLTEKYEAESMADLLAEISRLSDYLGSSRPTAVNLFWALNRMTDSVKAFVSANPDAEIRAAKDHMKAEAKQINKEDVEMCLKIAENGLSLLKPGMGLLTHCNAGALATSGCGTALAPMYLGNAKGYDFRIFADETRPLLQGARLTAWELQRSGADVTLICDNMASLVMKRGHIQAVITGADRIAANGDSANKIGTSGVSILAKEYGIPVYINAPFSTIDLDCPDGDSIVIEERPGEEIYRLWYEKPMSTEGVKTFNPAFDVTDAKYITAIVTDKGVAYPPFSESLKELSKK